MGEKEYLIFCDESDKKGKFYSNFYGGVLVGATRKTEVDEFIEKRKRSLGFFGELKWSKVSERYLDKYMKLMTSFFRLVRDGRVKVRIMFRQNVYAPTNLTAEQRRNTYFQLYYQFMKHAFGLRFAPTREEGTYLRLFFDQFPDTRELGSQFKGYIHALQETKHFRNNNILIRERDIVEVRSHDHNLLQCLDVVLGAMAFRLNDRHKLKPRGSYRRGSKTRAKEKLYKSILHEIRKWKSGFNPGITTGKPNGLVDLWQQPYRHWNFIPRDFEYDATQTK